MLRGSGRSRRILQSVSRLHYNSRQLLTLSRARKTFVDNVCRQVVERHLLRNLPKIFSPQTVAELTDEELERIAGERPDVVEKRNRLHLELKNLRAGLKDLRA